MISWFKVKKISGHAQYRYKQRMFSHGTLLFSTNLDALEQALNVSKDKIQNKGVKSIRARVDNLSNYISEPMNIVDFKKILLAEIFHDGYHAEHLLASDYPHIQQLRDKKYNCLHWNDDALPQANVRHGQRFALGKIEFKMRLESGMIKMIKFYGDFFSQRELSTLENLLTDQAYHQQTLSRILNTVSLEEYFGSIDHDTFIDFLMKPGGSNTQSI
jgi:lipoate-protein ligase A